jgi:hypothetical protein
MYCIKLLLNIKWRLAWHIQHKVSTKRLGTLSVTTFTLMSALLSFAVLHLALVGVLGGIEDIHWPLAANSTLYNDRQVLPDRLRHRDEDAGVVQVLLVCGPANTFLVALLRAWTLLKGKSGEEQQKACQKNESDTTGVQCYVGAAIR